MDGKKTYKKIGTPNLVLLLGAASLAFQACGSSTYSNVNSVTTSDAPGTFSIPPKVDVVLVEDDTGRMAEPYTSISSELTTFVDNLDSEGWNYHFTSVPLTNSNYTFQATASKQDVNWGSYWTAPFPGDPQSDSVSESLNASIFSTLTSYAGLNFPIFNAFVTQAEINNSETGSEPGFSNLENSFNNQIQGYSGYPTNFLRSDAMLAVIFVGTGNDTSYVNYCFGPDGTWRPCEQVISNACNPNLTPQQVYQDISKANIQTCNPASSSYSTCAAQQQQQMTAFNASQCQSAALSQSYYQQIFSQISPNLKVYAAVAAETYRTSGECLGNGYTSIGSRYQAMASAFGGTSYDICSASLPSILSDIQSDLTSIVLNYITSYVVVSPNQQPDPSTIVVQKYIGGSSSDAVTIPQSSTNGWTYVGYQTENLITYPTPMDQQTGYMIQLNGSAKLQGNDIAYITWKTPSGQAGTTTQSGTTSGQ